MKIFKEYMIKGIPLLHEESSMREILEIFSGSNHNILPVVRENETLAGLISIEELLNDLLFSKEDISILEKMSFFADFFSDVIENIYSISPLVLAKDIMQGNVFTIKESDSMIKAAVLMKKRNVHKLIVLNEKNVPTGYISRNEICKAFLM
jgi:predicted transcriptional regulator